MDFSWSEEQKTLKKGVIEFALAELNHGLSEREKQGAFSRAEWKKCADFGIQGIVVPREFGGSEKDVLTAALMMEGLGYGCRDLGLIFGINAQIWSVQLPILNFGTEAQKSRYLPAMCAGEMVGAHAMTEPDAGSDAFGLRLQAKRANGGYVLNGEKVYITNGPTADVALIFGKIAAESGEAGITGFLVERGSHAFEVSQGVDKMGMRTAQMGCFRLCDCFVPEENRLGEEGELAAGAAGVFDQMKLIGLAEASGDEQAVTVRGPPAHRGRTRVLVLPHALGDAFG